MSGPAANKDLSNVIALFLPSLRGGGAERVFLTIANELARQGREVHLLLAQAEGPLLVKVDARLQVVDLRARRMILALPALVRYLKENQPGALLSALPHTNLVALWARRLARVTTRVVVSERSTLSAGVAGAQKMKLRFLPFLIRASIPRQMASLRCPRRWPRISPARRASLAIVSP